MRKMALVGIATLLSAGAAMAQSSSGAMKMTTAQCDAAWTHADKANVGYLTPETASPFIANFKAVNTKGDGKITKSEFLTGCSKGLVTDSSATSGSSSGASGKQK